MFRRALILVIFALTILTLALVALRYPRDDGAAAKPAQDLKSRTAPLAPASSQAHLASASTRLGTEGTLELAAPDIDVLLADAHERDKKKQPYRFASAIKVNKSASELAPWTRKNGIASWELTVSTTGASSLNFAFDQFSLPPGAKLTLRSVANETEFTFTSRDNDDHGQLWTPLLLGEKVELSMTVPEQLLPQVRLNLASVNYGFRKMSDELRKIGGSRSGNCNVDVVCDAGDGPFGAMIDLYRNQIRSVAAYTLNGTDTCTGALINSTGGEQRPFFLTADHCGVRADNAPSMVLFWNFENSTCRTPGSSQSGGVGNGRLTVFNSGAIFRATSSLSDFCLVELDDPVNEDAGAYASGWDRTNADASQAIGIHHPGVAEKRISFEMDPLARTNRASDTRNNSGGYLRVADWDIGTTEGGSSGSPLFNGSGNIIGQLYGGSAACGNDAPDWYGRIASSWTGGGNSNSRLSNWLNPTNSSVSFLNGREVNNSLKAEDLAVTESDTGSTTANLLISIGRPFAETVTFDLEVAGGTATSGEDYLIPQLSNFSIPSGMTSVSIPITINGDATPEENETLLLNLVSIVNAAPIARQITVVILNDDFITPEYSGPPSLSAPSGVSLDFTPAFQNTPTQYTLSNAPSGLTIDSANGALIWDRPFVGEYLLQITASNEAGTATTSLTLTIVSGPFALATEMPPTVRIGGDIDDWVIDNEETFDGEDAVRIDQSSTGVSNIISLTLQGPDELSFWWRGSLLFPVFDRPATSLSLFLDDTFVTSLVGETGWHRQDLTIPEGEHVVSLGWRTDFRLAETSAPIWLDQFTLRSVSPPSFATRHNLAVVNNLDIATPIEPTFEVNSVTLGQLPNSWTAQDGSHLRGVADSPFTFQATAENENGSTTRTFTVEPFTPLIAIAQMVEAPTIAFRSPSPSFLARFSRLSTNGQTSARSAEIGDNQRSSLSSYVTGPGTLTFDWLVSSEAGFDFGFVQHNGRLVAVSSGATTFSPFSIALEAGLNEITWLYIKDSSVEAGQDALFLDNVRLTGYAKWVADNGLSPFQAPILSGTDGDGNSSLLEYALGLSPVTSEATANLTMSGSPADRVLSIATAGSVEDITVQIEKSISLAPGSWGVSGLESTSNPTMISARDRSGDAKSFYRLNVTAP